MDVNPDEKYLQILINRLEVCKMYQPRFGQGGEGISLQGFQALYSADPFYTWFGLDIPLMYAAHRAAGGITSVYRQIGIGVELLFRQILQDHLGLTDAQSVWSYEVTTSTRQARTLRLDGRIEPDAVADSGRRQIVLAWMQNAQRQLQIEPRMAQALRGVVIEIRQGYKSKDSKRQNADMESAAVAYTSGYLPVLVVLSVQIDHDLLERYRRGKWLVLPGTVVGDDLTSTYTFVRDVIGYDLAAFFQRNSDQLRQLTENVLESLLRADDETRTTRRSDL